MNFDPFSRRKDSVAFGSTSTSNEPVLRYSMGNSFANH